MWHKGVAALNWPTRMALSVLFGGMPDASNDKAIECLQRANDCYPNACSVVERAKVLFPGTGTDAENTGTGADNTCAGTGAGADTDTRGCSAVLWLCPQSLSSPGVGVEGGTAAVDDDPCCEGGDVEISGGRDEEIRRDTWKTTRRET